MTGSTLPYWAIRLTFALVLTSFLSHQSLRAGPPSSASQTAPTQSGAAQNSRPTSSTSGVQTPMPMHDVTKPGEAGQRRTTPLAATPAQTDYGVFQLGGKVYSSGTEDVIVR